MFELAKTTNAGGGSTFLMLRLEDAETRLALNGYRLRLHPLLGWFSMTMKFKVGSQDILHKSNLYLLKVLHLYLLV